MPFILALDQGTTSSRAMVFDQAGAVRAVAQREFRQIFPQPGWVEHDPMEIWDTQLAVAREALAKAGLRAHDIAAIGITNQRETTVVWDRKTGVPIHNAIVWQDRRTADHCETLKADGHGADITRRTGLVLDAYFSATKIRWLLDNVAGARKLANTGRLAFGTIDSWLLWNLTGGAAHFTDVSNASRTLLYNSREGGWDDVLVERFNVLHNLLPKVARSSDIVGDTARGVFDTPIPIAGIAGDQQAALFGQRCVTPGLVKNTYGTGCFMLMHTGERIVHSQQQLLTTCAVQHGAEREYALEGSVFIGGAVVQWLRDGLGIIQSASEVEALATRVADNGGVYFVPAFAGLGSPHWDPYARGNISGLTRGSTAAHIARAALESIAYQTADVLDAMQKDSGIAITELRVDGGAACNDFLMQFQADVLGVPVVRPRVTETTALGAAYLAGLAVGYWKSAAEIDAQWSAERRFEPIMPQAHVQELRMQWNQAIQRTRR
ncbi:MAG: glycerol kinase GlpK [Burkholderiales bacterium]